MSGLCGYVSFNQHGSNHNNATSTDVITRMLGQLSPDITGKNNPVWQSEGCALGVVNADNAAESFESDVKVVISGSPYWQEAEFNQVATREGAAAAFVAVYRRFGQDAVTHTKGEFSLALIDTQQRIALLAIDRIGIQSMAYAVTGDTLVFGTTTNAIAAHPATTATIDDQGIYHYLYFHMVPSPGTIYKEQQKLLPSEHLVFSDGAAKTTIYWRPSFSEVQHASLSQLSDELKQVLGSAVRRLSSENTGAFLSGGIDSSSVAGLLSQVYPGEARTYSIGFNAEGYDEIEYARIAANHFKLKSHEYYVTPDDVLDAVQNIAEYYDEPYGNSSAVPAYYCARFAKQDGVDTLLAGDGGDELFAGNARYAKQGIFEYYNIIPQFLRRALVEPLFTRLPKGMAITPLRKISSYIEQARVPLPKRLESYNFFERVDLKATLSDEFYHHVNKDAPESLMRSAYEGVDDASTLNRMLYLDWKQTLADNDIRKVNKMCQLAGINVAYPMLDQDVVAFSTQIPSPLKLKKHQLRYFYKAAMKDFLPSEIINKKKHGFGLPFGVWLLTSPKLKELAYDSIADFRSRGYFKGAFLDQIMQQHENEHAAYYGELVWVIMMLELWLKAHQSVGQGK